MIYESKESKIQKWHKWFAWFPVSINCKTVWFEPVERRAIPVREGEIDIEWEYRMPNGEVRSASVTAQPACEASSAEGATSTVVLGTYSKGEK